MPTFRGQRVNPLLSQSKPWFLRGVLYWGLGGGVLFYSFCLRNFDLYNPRYFFIRGFCLHLFAPFYFLRSLAPLNQPSVCRPDHWNAAARRQFWFVLVPQDVIHEGLVGSDSNGVVSVVFIHVVRGLARSLQSFDRTEVSTIFLRPWGCRL